MDKKSPVDVSSKLTDAFGSKGVVGRVIPDEELPADAEGNRAEILGPGTFNPLGIDSIEDLGPAEPMSRKEALLKLIEETPPGSICGYWKYPVQG